MLVCLALPACKKGGGPGGVMMSFDVGRQKGHPTMKLESVTIVFEGVKDPWPDVPVVGSGAFQVTGGGTASGSMGFGALSLTTVYANGVQTVTGPGAVSFKVVSEGRQIQFADRTVSTDGPWRTVYLVKDGSTRVAE
jgi:hypothetical protein